MIKIDTQGYEPQVFRGLEKTLARAAAEHILSEYWPSGMELLRTNEQDSQNCLGTQMILALDSNYSIMDMSFMAHPGNSKTQEREFSHERKHRPVELDKLCNWFLNRSKWFSNEEHSFGYWTDILASMSF